MMRRTTEVDDDGGGDDELFLRFDFAQKLWQFILDHWGLYHTFFCLEALGVRMVQSQAGSS